MNSTDWKRRLRVILATLVLIVLAFDMPSGVESQPETPSETPSLEEVAVLEELLEWIRNDRQGYGLPASRAGELAETVRSRPRSFQLFRTFTEKSVRRELLREVPYADLIERTADRYGLDPLLLASVIEAESGFDPAALSPAGALGLMQVLPSTASLYGTAAAEAREPAVNVRVGARYLKGLLREFDGDLVLALAAYNAGPGAVQRFDGVPPYRETERYVERVLSRYVDHHQQVWDVAGARQWLFF